MEKDFCNLSINCDGNCPEWVNCPLDAIDDYTKDRHTSRNRHHSMLKERNSANKIAGIISAKLACIPDPPKTDDPDIEIEKEPFEVTQKRAELKEKLKSNKSKCKMQAEEK